MWSCLNSRIKVLLVDLKNTCANPGVPYLSARLRYEGDVPHTYVKVPPLHSASSHKIAALVSAPYHPRTADSINCFYKLVGRYTPVATSSHDLQHKIDK